MKEITVSLTSNFQLPKLACCIGYFDGIHLGHQALINKAVNIAKENKIQSGLITFNPDPWVVLKGVKDVEHITSIKQRKEIVAKLGIDYWISIEFSKEVADLTPNDFVLKFINQLNVKYLICGFDFTYGKFGQGKIDDLLKYSNFETIMVESVNYLGKKISSSRIETEIGNGNMELVSKLLSRPYTIEAKVIPGRHLGHTLGFATCNLDINHIYVIPQLGVYAGYLIYQNQYYQAMINFGHNPTLNYTKNISMEVHIIDFDQDIYGETVEVLLIKHIRPEIKFNSKDELVNQLKHDKQEIINYLNK